MPIPSVAWPVTQDGSGSVAPAADLTSTATTAEDRKANILGIGGCIPVIYGRTNIGARTGTVVTQGNDLLMLCVVGRGEIDAIESVTMDGEALPDGVTWTAYTGTSGQTADPWLVAAFAAQSIAYADALPGIAYAVVRVPQGASTGFPELVFTVRGRKLYDDRTTTTAYTDNPALALTDFLRNTTYGCGMTVDSASVIAAADYCDAMIGSPAEKRRIIGLALTEQQKSGEWINTLRTYAGCFVDRSGSQARLVLDAPASVEMAFDETNVIEGSLKLRKRGTANTPTVMRITWSNPDKKFADEYAEVVLAGVTSGVLDRRESSIPLPGVTRYSQAMREATERLNKLWLTDLEVTFSVFDEGLKLLPGAVVSVTHPIGLTVKAFRVSLVDCKGNGRWDISATEYDAAVYSDAVSTTPTTPDTALPNPLNPPAVMGLTLAEEVFQMLDGSWSSRIVATWTAPTWAYLAGYRVEIYDAGSNLLAAAPVTGPLWRSGAVEEAQLYTVRVAAVSTLAVGAWTSATKTPAGKYLLPSNVPTLTGFEVGGEVRLTIGASTDLDMTGYEVRYGPVACSWALSSTVKFVDFINAASGVGGYCIYKDAPAGTWDFLVCARDSIGQYSPTPARITITVTLDVNSFLVDNHDFSAGTPTLTGMTEYSLPCDPARYFVTEDSVAFGTKFSSALSTYTNPLATYHAAGTSEFLTNAYDFGQALAGNWSGTLTSVAMSGTKSDVLRLSPDGTTYTDESGLTARTVARFGKLKSSAAGTDTLLVTMPDAKLRIDAIPRVENGTITTSATTFVTVTLANAYASVKSIPLTPIGSAPIHAVADAITVGATTSFNIYAFNSVSGAQVAAPVMWEFQGV